MEIRFIDASVEKFIKSLEKSTIAMAIKNYKQFKRKLLKDQEIKEAYEKLGPEFDLIKMIIKKRIFDPEKTC